MPAAVESTAIAPAESVIVPVVPIAPPPIAAVSPIVADVAAESAAEFAFGLHAAAVITALSAASERNDRIFIWLPALRLWVEALQPWAMSAPAPQKQHGHSTDFYAMPAATR
jgi:hypothetical protein